MPIDMNAARMLLQNTIFLIMTFSLRLITPLYYLYTLLSSIDKRVYNYAINSERFRTWYNLSMLGTSEQNFNVAVLRGGKKTHGQSLKEGQSVISSLEKHGIGVADIYIDEEGNFIKNGITIEPHNIFAQVDGYVDTSDQYHMPHHALASRMGLKNFVSYKEVLPVVIDREGVYRILRQAGIKVPETYIIRKTQNDFIKSAREVWMKFHTPLLVRPIDYVSDSPSSLVKSFQDLIRKTSEYHSAGHDVHILSYKSVPTFSTAVLPNYRGEDFYVPLTVQTFVGKHEVPNVNSVTIVYVKAEEEKKNSIKNLAKKTSEVLQITGPVCVDIVFHNGSYIVVNVDLKPSLRDDGRFAQSLASTGCDIGHYIKSRL